MEWKEEILTMRLRGESPNAGFKNLKIKAMQKTILQRETVLTNMGEYSREKTAIMYTYGNISNYWYVHIMGDTSECYKSYEAGLERFNNIVESLNR